MDIHRAGVTEVIEAPDLVQQLIAGIDPVGGGGQVVEQLHLLGGRVHLFAVDGELEGIHVNDQLVENQTAGLFLGSGSGAAAQHRLDAGQDLLHFEGLGDVVIGAVFETGYLVIGLALGGEHDDGSLALSPDSPADRPAIHDRHHHVQQHQVRLNGPELGQPLAAVCGDGHGVALFFQIHLQKLRNIPVVFYDQYRYCHW